MTTCPRWNVHGWTRTSFCHYGRTEQDDLELSYSFLPEHWGHGYAHEACAAVLDRGFANVPDTGRIVAITPGGQSPLRPAAPGVGHGEDRRVHSVRRPSGDVRGTPLSTASMSAARTSLGRMPTHPSTERPQNLRRNAHTSHLSCGNRRQSDADLTA
ncbi:GNAT family N-acetyltransferase [Nonomuraea sp. 10N515B]|uniref:GNAT family N-acetyltransferase n=1 Tax=Nonomuraea sp. 10N515B TaxID=3457422 RepID=UPI003FCD6E76